MLKRSFLISVAFLFAWFANGNAQFSFTRHVAGNVPSVNPIFPVDLDSDGDLDIVVGAWRYTPKICWLENLGAGNFGHRLVDGAADAVGVGGGLSACDLNGDGYIDVAAPLSNPSGSVADNEVAWYANDGHQNFTKHSIYHFGQPDYVFTTDLDDDGDNDVLATFWGIPNVGRAIWCENDGAGNFTVHVIVDNYVMGRSLAAADFDGDGDKDIVTTAAYVNARMEWWENDGNENFTHHFLEYNIDCVEFEVHDFNGDGRDDLLYSSVSPYNGHVAWLSWQGTTVTKHVIAAVQVYGIAAADFNNDQRLEIVANHHGLNQTHIYYETPSGYSNYLLDGSNNASLFLITGDFDQDGDTDVASAGSNANAVYWYENQCNHSPVANAGSNQTVEATSPAGAEVTLDGSGSSDPDNDQLTYTWRENGKVIAWPTTDPTSEVTLALGSHTIELTVDDGKDVTNTDEVIINVVDTTPPTITVALNPNVLWPPNHKLVDIQATVTVNDIVDTQPTFTLTSIVSDEPDNGLGDGDKPKDIQEAVFGTPDVDFKLRAERSGKGNGRIYRVTYTANDASGNSASASATVTVTHDMGKAVAFGENIVIPENFALMQNYPNPFNPETEIRFALPIAANAVVKLFSTLGEEIRMLVNETFEAGYHTVRWDGKDKNGNPVPSGVYFYQLRAGSFLQVKKMSLLR